MMDLPPTLRSTWVMVVAILRKTRPSRRRMVTTLRTIVLLGPIILAHRSTTLRLLLHLPLELDDLSLLHLRPRRL